MENKFLRAKITPGMFSGERVFELPTGLKGMAHRQYFRTLEGEPLSPEDRELEGFVECFIRRTDYHTGLHQVEVASGDNLLLERELIFDRPLQLPWEGFQYMVGL